LITIKFYKKNGSLIKFGHGIVMAQGKVAIGKASRLLNDVLLRL